MHCLVNVVQIQRYPVGQSCFTEKVMTCEIKEFGDGTKRFENENETFW